jgi:hypothetical protein
VTVFNSRLLTPPREEEDVYPYRRVWPSIVIEYGILFAVALGLYITENILGFRLPAPISRPLGLILVLLPVGLWAVISLRREKFVPEPRRQLFAVVIVSALVANAIGVPIIRDFLEVERWLPLTTALNRIIGYTFTVGIVQEFLKYLILRYVVWPSGFRARLDAVAYSAANAVGFATVLNLHFLFDGSPPPDVVAGVVFATCALHLVSGLVVGYALGELCFSRPSPFLLPASVLLAAFITGVAIPVRAGLVNAGFVVGISATKPLLGLFFSLALLVGLLSILAFLFNSAERQAREAVVEEV